MASTTTAVFPVAADAFDACEDALQRAYNEIEDLAWALQAAHKAHLRDEPLPAPPSYEDVGPLCLFAAHVKEVSGWQVIMRAEEILEVLPEIEDIIRQAENPRSGKDA